MKTIFDLLHLSTEYLQKRGVLSARRQAELLLCEALGIKRIDLYTDGNRPLLEKEVDRCRAFLLRRSNGEPLAYISGLVEFFGCRFQINSSVLIPRQETEILVDKIAEQLSKIDLSNKVLWDVCCGSGCIGISLQKRFPQLQVALSDLSSDALEIAKKNSELNQTKVSFYEGDLFTPFQGKKADFIVCNPPYVSELDYQTLDKEVKDFEPRLALVGGITGLEFYERLAKEMPYYLKDDGLAWFEIGTGQGNALKTLFKDCIVRQDWSGHDRFVYIRKELF